MQRAAVLWRASPARLLIALFALLLAGGMAAATGANFNSTTSNPANVVTAGVISHDNDKAGATVLNVLHLMPGQPESGTVKITNTGDAAAASSVTLSNLTATSGSTPLAPALDVSLTADGTPVDLNGAAAGTSAKLSALTSIPLGAWAVGEDRDYVFTVELPDTGPDGADNAYQGAGLTVDMTWELTS
ncbi:MAG TPA: hypothetical protein VE526_07895 [Solirubrobacteraceae bacterium]|jgi:hypothetical protein|nr:hypothetical protein [Solirubrobacteraceae bacterium]